MLCRQFAENEVVSLATFGEDLQFLAEKSGDEDELTDGYAIEFHDQITYLTDFYIRRWKK